MHEPVSTAPCSPLSDVDGRIAHVFLGLPATDPVVSANLLSCFRGIFEALGSGVRYTILHHAAHEHELARVAAEAGVSDLDLVRWNEGFTWRVGGGGARLEGTTLVIGRPAWPDFTHWVQDAFVVDSTPGVARVWATPRLSRLHGGLDEQVPARLAEHLGWSCETLPCVVEAGNLLVDRSSVLIGADVRDGNTPTAVAALEGLLAGPELRRVLWLPREGAQPVFHQDVYAALAGRGPGEAKPKALVGSVRAARAIVREAPREDDPDGALDTVADELERAGYVVARLPLLPFFEEGDAQHRWITYNNGLVEVFEEAGALRRRVILPAYAADGGPELGALDEAAATIWAGLGFQVSWARGRFRWLARSWGNLRCMTKVLRREQLP